MGVGVPGGGHGHDVGVGALEPLLISTQQTLVPPVLLLSPSSQSDWLPAGSLMASL